MNPLTSLPDRCEVLVVGAGPSGSACAQWLARHGVDVLLVDAQTFPRDKTCGDGLIPDAHAALARLGVLDEVMAKAQPVGHVRCIGPSGRGIDVPGTLAVLPRRELDAIVCRAAVDAGARFFAPARFEAPLEDAAGRVVGARLKTPDGVREVQAGWVVLATGAVPQAMLAAGLCDRRTPSGVALRGYVKNDAMTGRITELDVVWHRKLKGGYGWIFPCGGGVFNIGAGLLSSHDIVDGRAAMQDTNLRDLFAAFTDVYPPARQLMDGGTVVGELKGAPLRCSLDGARYSRPGLIATGEAVGSTYSFTGEGIGKALETGLLAAEAVVEGRRHGSDEASVRSAYEGRLKALKPKFDLYEKGNKVNAHPWLADLLIWRAKKSERLLRRMAGVLNETSNPGQLVTARGLLKLFTE
jgi:geranylgeranyl reductase family protein